jgi:hypothetical protein
VFGFFTRHVHLETAKDFSILLKNNKYLYLNERSSLSADHLDPVELPSELSKISPVSTDWHSHQGTMVEGTSQEAIHQDDEKEYRD